MPDYDYHTADGAETPHVAVFTVEDWREVHRVAEFYSLPGEGLDVAENRAIAFLAVLREKGGRCSVCSMASKAARAKHRKRFF